MTPAPHWSAIRLQPYRERLALAELARNGFETYCPRLLERLRMPHGRKIDATPLLFPGYIFVAIVLQWYSAHRAPGVIGFLMDGERPARVPDSVIDGLKSRERNGVIALPKKPEPGGRFQMNERLRVRDGPLRGLFGLYAGQAPRDRILVLMDFLGGKQQVEMAAGNVIQV
jgi:transcriptional antiterminator RfaH